jgi:hypothetical protein
MVVDEALDVDPAGILEPREQNAMTVDSLDASGVAAKHLGRREDQNLEADAFDRYIRRGICARRRFEAELDLA